jgi:1-acyl-sn-glycerol-3-phosphate acyltransferase
MDTCSPPIFIRLLKHVLSRFGKVEVSGAEYLDGAEGGVVVCNHVGWADPLWLGYAALPRILHQMAKKELFENAFLGWFVRLGGGFSIDRSKPASATIRQVISLVAEGKLVLIYPQGTRTRAKVEAKRGAATIALYARGRIVPAVYEGPENIRLAHLFRRPAIHIRFGPPIQIHSQTPADKEEAIRLTVELERAMHALSSHHSAD